jgi:ABC-2 type transport system permease protein
MLLCFIVVFAVVIFTGVGVNFLALLTLPVIMIVEYVLALGMALLTSAVTVYFRDLEHILGIVSMAWMYMTPIMYDKSIVPERFLPIFNINPMTHVIECYRSVLYNKEVPDLTSLLSALSLGVLFLLIGCLVFNKLQRHFAEEL